MKKLGAFLVCAVMAFGLVGCGSGDSTESKSTTQAETRQRLLRMRSMRPIQATTTLTLRYQRNRPARKAALMRQTMLTQRQVRLW